MKNNYKKIITKIAINLFAFILVFSPFFVLAQATPYTGLIKCDGVVTAADISSGRVKCSTLTFIANINWIINWGFGVVILAALVFFAYSGILHIWAGFNGDYGMASKSKEYFWNVVIGLFWMSCGWMIVKTLIAFLTGGEFGLDFI